MDKKVKDMKGDVKKISTRETIYQEPDKSINQDPVIGTASEGGMIKCQVKVGSKGEIKGVAPENLESLRPKG